MLKTLGWVLHLMPYVREFELWRKGYVVLTLGDPCALA